MNCIAQHFTEQLRADINSLITFQVEEQRFQLCKHHVRFQKQQRWKTLVQWRLAARERTKPETYQK